MKKITEDWLLSAESDLSIIDKVIDIKELTLREFAHTSAKICENCFDFVENGKMGR